MKSPFPKTGAQVDEEILKEDEIDELSDDLEDEISTIASAEEELPVAEVPSQLVERVEELEARLREAEDARMRALADYQNLQRRSQADRATWSKIASEGMVVAILEPLEHLMMAAEQLHDKGLTMVVKQLFDRLEAQGLKKIEVVGKPFNPEMMEAIEGSNPNGKKVSAVVRNGYTLNGVLVQLAKVKIE